MSPLIKELLEVRFVPVDWTDPRGYKFVIVDDPIVIDYYKEYFERGLIRARDRVRLCNELIAYNTITGHEDPRYGCGKRRDDGTTMCAYMVGAIERDRYKPEQPVLVRITIPI